MAFCSACGSRLTDSARFCPSCGATSRAHSDQAGPLGGAPQSAYPVAPSPASRQTPNKGCGTALLWTGGIVLALIAGCTGLAMLGQRTAEGVAHYRPTAAEAREQRYIDSISRASLNQLTNRINGINAQYGEKLFTKTAIGLSNCTLTVDGNIYEVLSEQDKRIVLRIAGVACVAAYRQPHGGDRNERRLPDGGLSIVIDDESGQEVAHDLWSRQ
jgi:zinc-ribbon domain